ncbi:MAG: hypothetical protein QOE90_3107 [Thermoplasmata archaeon]|jgi:predicted lipid-binding transport protein (Tim44 family)|nr:hypothetical protein [Thermoplasmata archaeon]
MSPGSSHLAVGSLFVLAGAGSLVAGLVHASWLPASFLTLTGSSLACIVGFVLLLGGLLMTLFAFQRHEPPADVVPAEVAFASRMVVADPHAAEPVPTPAPRPRAAPARAPAPAPARASAPRRPPAGATAAAASAAPAPAVAPTPGLDEQIRELTRRISKAGVMLATGQISQQGYASYVDDLKRQRGALEAKRVEQQMGTEL